MSTLIIIWLVVGIVAAWQRDYFSGEPKTCAKGGTIAATIGAGPLNYVGADPKVNCTLPQPSD